ncbi:Calcyclin-binding protein-like [Oopsacas minuta]|uniref:Calcyclin-binding protein-like n=1 Tax=Oopsacas minuta TaxID=111878 RepID=A0AAV7JPJ5_9METZ|nr:Calcyclin-binding protein-like [Oopsacas minuta]
MDIEAFVQELESLIPQAKHPMTISLLQDAINRNKSSISKTIKPQHATPAVQIKPTIQVKTYGWDQTDSTVKIYVSDIPGLEGAIDSQIVTEFTANSVNVKVNDLNNRNYNFSIGELSGKIKADSAKAILKRGSVIISMPKASPGNWEEVTMVERKTKEAKKEKEKLDDISKKDSDDPSAGIMKMMQKMYDEGDEDMKRTITKAWYESKSGKTPSVPGAPEM